MNTLTLAEREKAILSDLKDFQRSTVERCFDLFHSGQKRILVADEVGLGKTLIAKGIIAKLAHHHKQTRDNLFKVLYICSNTAIANQNISKLKIYDGVTVDGISDTRLSMQHLKIFEQENNPVVKAGYIQLIPLTPATSFTLTRGSGNARERALFYVILKHLPEFREHQKELHQFLMRYATQGFDWWVDEMSHRVVLCEEKSGGEYLRGLIAELRAKLPGDLINSVIERKPDSIAQLRLLFARISTGRLNPDLVIMDEFQRFRELITASPDSDTGLLTNAFLKGKNTNTLLLSATPYKLYQTLEEAAESGIDEHYQEFLELMSFLFSDEAKNLSFKETWSGFSHALRERTSDFGTLITIKRNAEQAMYSGICRTERLLIESDENFVDDRLAKRSLEISDADILSFIVAENLSDAVHVPIEYVKSCPYLLSFMEHYKYKADIKKSFMEHNKYKTDIKKLKPALSRQARKLLFVDERKLRGFESLPTNNARLEHLTQIAFSNGVEKLLWVPPSIPYYPPSGVFKGKEDFSKILIFSAWEMVPRMIACTLSYECERRTIGKLYAKETNKQNKGYFANTNNRFPYRKLTTDAAVRALTLPSIILADAYHPIQYFGWSLARIKTAIKPYIEDNIGELQNVYGFSGRHASLTELYTNMAIASPAVCALRLFRDEGLAEKLASKVADMFDKPEAVAVIELAYGKSEDAYYKNILKYCVDGNFAAMLDEYAHVLNNDNMQYLCQQMCEALQAATASYSVDTYSNFTENKKTRIRMRSHYAVGFYQTQGDEKTSQRKEHLRTAFNAPFRPFILATTSIGQEGLDFHNYTRKIMHWNLPHNPIDIEQREGRINRYKCLAIRQSLAKKYGSVDFKDDIWEEVFSRALEAKNADSPELIPYWCLPGGGVVKIERIIPMYPYSKDKALYERLIKILSLYRVTLGHARQEELLEYLFNNCDLDKIKELFINLSPFAKKGMVNEL